MLTTGYGWQRRSPLGYSFSLAPFIAARAFHDGPLTESLHPH